MYNTSKWRKEEFLIFNGIGEKICLFLAIPLNNKYRYGNNYYDYQIAVVFAILIVALLILGAFILAIYYVFVVNVSFFKYQNCYFLRLETRKMKRMHEQGRQVVFRQRVQIGNLNP